MPWDGIGVGDAQRRVVAAVHERVPAVAQPDAADRRSAGRSSTSTGRSRRSRPESREGDRPAALAAGRGRAPALAREQWANALAAGRADGEARVTWAGMAGHRRGAMGGQRRDRQRWPPCPLRRAERFPDGARASARPLVRAAAARAEPTPARGRPPGVARRHGTRDRRGARDLAPHGPDPTSATPWKSSAPARARIWSPKRWPRAIWSTDPLLEPGRFAAAPIRSAAGEMDDADAIQPVEHELGRQRRQPWS